MLTKKQRKKFLTTLHNPRYSSADHTGAIILTGIFKDEFMTFFASPYDKMLYGRIIYAKAIAEAYGKIREFNPSENIDLG
jgi:hypothetical protein